MATNNALNNTASNLTVSNGFSVTSGTVTISPSGAAINIGTDAVAKTITIGAAFGTTAVNVNTNGAPNAYTVSSGAGIIMRAVAAGTVSFPLQSAFYYYLNTNDANVTGNGAVYQLGTTGNVLTLLYDQNNNCSTLGVFTAPVTGLYNFVATIKFSTLSLLMTSGILSIVTTGGTGTFEINTGNAQNAANTYSFNCSYFTSMTAGNTCYVTAQISNGAGNTATATAGSRGSTFFTGYLVA